MATISIPKELTPVTINKFLGLNSAEESETQLTLGEASDMLNLRITDNYKLETIEGYKNIFEQEDKIENLFVGKIFGNDTVLFRKDNSIYKLENENTISKISGNYEINDCSYICFGNAIYILDGNEFYSYDGTIFDVVEGYVPLVAIGTLPSGGGTDYERINLLSNRRHQTFSPDGTSTEFVLRESALASIDTVMKNGEPISTGYTKNAASGKVVFDTAPAEGVDTIDIWWTVIDNSPRELITKNKYMTLYGTANDTRVFFYGNDEYKNRYYYSDIGGGTPDAEYIPATNFKDEGVTNYAITGLVKHYDRLVVFKENETRYAIYEDLQTTNSTGDEITLPALKSYPLNDKIGNKAINQVQLINNYPVCINDNGLYMFNQTNVKAETNVNYLSQRIENELSSLEASKVKLFDHEARHELLIIYDDLVYVYNYQINVFSKIKLAHKPNSFMYYNKQLYFSCDKGIMKFDDEYVTFDGEIIEQNWESSYYNFEKDYKRKNVNRLYVTLKPFYATNVDITFSTDRGDSRQTFNITQRLLNFKYVDFNNFSFKYSNSIKPYRKKMKAKKFVFLKLKLHNDLINTRFNIDSISLKYTIGGETK